MQAAVSQAPCRLCASMQSSMWAAMPDQVGNPLWEAHETNIPRVPVSAIIIRLGVLSRCSAHMAAACRVGAKVHISAA